MATISNTVTLVANETLANSLGAATLLANTVQAGNLTANGSTVEFQLLGQSLPIAFGSENIYPAVLVQVYAGANGNATDQLLVSGNVIPTQDVSGGFLVNGLLVLKGNAKAAGANAGQVWGGLMQVPGTVLGGSVKTITNFYCGGAANGNVTTGNLSSNTCNISFYAQPQTGANTNASITSLVCWVANANGSVGLI